MSRNKKPYFKSDNEGPPPLSATTNRKVRFEEVDPLGIVWHGRYPSYFEDGRVAFGDKFDLSYITMRKENFYAPIVKMHIDYHHPLKYHEEMTIISTLHWSDAAKLNFEYEILTESGQVATTGYTVQLLTNLDKDTLMTRPEFVEKFCDWDNENSGLSAY